MHRFAVCALLLCAAAVDARREVREYTIDLDLAPEDRFVQAGLLAQFNSTVWQVRTRTAQAARYRIWTNRARVCSPPPTSRHFRPCSSGTSTSRMMRC